MVGRTAFDLSAEEVVQAALEILRERGLDAVSMRTVAARLGVSPVPLYSRVGNKDDLLAAMAEHVLADVAPAPEPDEPWQEYARRWAGALRGRLVSTADVRRLLGTRRPSFVAASRPLIHALRAAGFSADEALRACRLVIWTTAGFALIEPASRDSLRASGRAAGSRESSLPGSDPAGVSREEADHLFEVHLRYVLEGIERDAARSGDASARAN